MNKNVQNAARTTLKRTVKMAQNKDINVMFVSIDLGSQETNLPNHQLKATSLANRLKHN